MWKLTFRLACVLFIRTHECWSRALDRSFVSAFVSGLLKTDFLCLMAQCVPKYAFDTCLIFALELMDGFFSWNVRIFICGFVGGNMNNIVGIVITSARQLIEMEICTIEGRSDKLLFKKLRLAIVRIYRIAANFKFEHL